MLASSSADAFDRFERARKDDLLVQGVHHEESGGRHLSDILGVLGDELQSPSDCPARIMPLWLSHSAFRLFRGQSLDSAKAWGSQFYAELKRLDGRVPFSVVHDWHANIVEPFVIEFSQRPEPNPWRSAGRPQALQALHASALGGDKIPADEWYRVLHDAFLHIFADRTSINLNDIKWPPGDLVARPDKSKIFHGARLADVNARPYGEAFASADAGEYARANAEPTSLGQGFDSYAEAAVTAYSSLSIHADFLAYSGKHPPYDKYNAIMQKNGCNALARFADGLVQSLARVVP